MPPTRTVLWPPQYSFYALLRAPTCLLRARFYGRHNILSAVARCISQPIASSVRLKGDRNWVTYPQLNFEVKEGTCGLRPLAVKSLLPALSVCARLRPPSPPTARRPRSRALAPRAPSWPWRSRHRPNVLPLPPTASVRCVNITSFACFRRRGPNGYFARLRCHSGVGPRASRLCSRIAPLLVHRTSHIASLLVHRGPNRYSARLRCHSVIGPRASRLCSRIAPLHVHRASHIAFLLVHRGPNRYSARLRCHSGIGSRASRLCSRIAPLHVHRASHIASLLVHRASARASRVASHLCSRIASLLVSAACGLTQIFYPPPPQRYWVARVLGVTLSNLFLSQLGLTVLI